MTFKDLLSIWNGLRNRKLQSIRKGAEITITDIDYSGGRIAVRSSSGSKSRSFAELEKVWVTLRADRIAHVDSVLGGSGSSRNQPETLFAALPFVEYTVIDQKKHLVLLDEATHEAGTLKKASPTTVREIQRRVEEAKRAGLPEMIVPVKDVKLATDTLETLTGRPGVSEAQGEYVYELGTLRIRVVSELTVNASYRGRTVLSGFTPRSSATDESIKLGDQLLLVPRKS
jgi:hypothetical protein